MSKKITVKLSFDGMGGIDRFVRHMADSNKCPGDYYHGGRSENLRASDGHCLNTSCDKCWRSFLKSKEVEDE